MYQSSSVDSTKQIIDRCKAAIQRGATHVNILFSHADRPFVLHGASEPFTIFSSGAHDRILQYDAQSLLRHLSIGHQT